VVALRSLLFNAIFYSFAVTLVILWTPTLLLPRRAAVKGIEIWATVTMRLLRIAGISVEIRGCEHLPRGPALIAAKHQSAWDTMAFHAVLHDPTFVMKRELFHIPFYGWHIRRAGMIGIDRKAGARGLRDMVAQARRYATEGRPIVIFPEGTRVAPGDRLPYRPGVAALYSQLDLPCVPVALNSGLFWPRRRFVRRPGRMVLEFLPALPPGLNRKDFIAKLEAAIETASDRLLDEADGRARPDFAGTAGIGTGGKRRAQGSPGC
jgi:1-acyl-sn-glycerol-3-phosphate acyltransferase